jgi:hypothetical protein
MGRAIQPEWTVNLLPLGKEPWRFKNLKDQLNMYRQQWQSDRQNQIIAKMAGKMPGKKHEGKRKNRGNNNSENLKNVEYFNCGKNGHYSTDCSIPSKITMNSQTWYPSQISKPISIFIEINVDQKGQTSK